MFSNKFLAFVFAIMAFPTCLLMSVALPPMQAPDEVVHYAYARSISLGQFTAEDRGPIATGLTMESDAALIWPFHKLTFDKNSKANRSLFENADVAKMADDKSVNMDITGVASYFPAAYFMSALGIKLAEVSGASALDQLYVGRFFNTLMYIGISTLVITITPAAALSFFFIFLLPMNLQQAASMSPDAFSFPATGLAIALFLCVINNTDSAKRDNLLIWSATIITVVAAMTRLPVILVGILPLFYGLRKKDIRFIFSFFMIAVPVFIWMYFYSFPEANANRALSLGHVSPSEQILLIVNNPLIIFDIASNTIRTFWYIYAVGALGVFGTLDIYMSPVAYLAITIVLLASVMFSKSTVRTSIDIRLILLLIGILMAGASIAAIYLTWTVVGTPLVLGFQGRYLMPTLIALAFAGGGYTSDKLNARVIRPLIFLIVSLHGILSAHFLSLIISRFYLS